MSKKVIVSVINDLVTDQRVKKSCRTLTDMGFQVLLVGRRLPNSPPMDQRPYPIIRMKLCFTRGPFFYACFNIRLFFLLLFKKADLLIANDLDTLLPNFLNSKIKGIPLIYDTHEYFTEVPELINRRHVQRIWQRIEEWIFPRLQNIITVNDSIAELYHEKYVKLPAVVRNVSPYLSEARQKQPEKGEFPEDKKMLILQGSGINIQRGAEEMVLAMQHIDQAFLLIVGGGDVIPLLKQMVEENKLGERVFFRKRMPYDELMAITSLADLGLTLDKDSNINYRFSLPNKLFDYIQARVPVIASPLPEVRKIIETYDIGDFIPDHQPEMMAEKINEVLANQGLMARW
ncbi:MAG: glycosyltransferase, partial [bacterium]